MSEFSDQQLMGSPERGLQPGSITQQSVDTLKKPEDMISVGANVQSTAEADIAKADDLRKQLDTMPPNHPDRTKIQSDQEALIERGKLQETMAEEMRRKAVGLTPENSVAAELAKKQVPPPVQTLEQPTSPIATVPQAPRTFMDSLRGVASQVTNLIKGNSGK